MEACSAGHRPRACGRGGRAALRRRQRTGEDGVDRGGACLGAGKRSTDSWGDRTPSRDGFSVRRRAPAVRVGESIVGAVHAQLVRSQRWKPVLGEVHSIYRLFAELAEASPLVLLIDDADLADEQSLRLLLYVTERISNLSMSVVLTGGSVPPQRAPKPLVEIARHRSTTRSKLKPLSVSGTLRRVAKTSLSASARRPQRRSTARAAGTPSSSTPWRLRWEWLKGE